MRKRVFPRIAWFLFLNCVTFVILVMVQFTRGGNFSEKIGDMLISGRYASETSVVPQWRLLDGEAKVFFGGLEFLLPGSEYIAIIDDGAVFTLSGGAEISFISQSPDELQISGKSLSDASAIQIPLRTQRSSLVRNSDNEALNILYNGSRYQFNRPLHSLESGQFALVLAGGTVSVVSYRTVSEEKEFSPVDFILPQVETAQAFSDVLSRWTTRNFAFWAQMGSQPDEDTVIAWCGEAVRQGNYRSAVSVVPVGFSSSPQRTWESAVYQFDRRIGVWERAARAISVSDREKTNLISRLLADRDNRIFNEKNLLEYLAVRGNISLLDNFISFAQGIDPATVTLEAAPGILESCLDMDKWYPLAANPFEPLAEQAYRLTAEALHKIEDQVFIFSNDLADIEFNLRLGLAIQKWGEKSGNTVWAAVGRSIVFSVISLGNDNGAIPILLAADESGVVVASTEQISSARLYRLLDNNENLPHAQASGVRGIWAWTASPAVNVSQSDNQLNISIRFPVGETHYVMLRNIRPFALLQIYGTNWRRAVDFESYYDSSGWYYFEQEQTLVIKLRHRTNTENVRIYFTAPSEPSVPPQEQQPAVDRQE